MEVLVNTARTKHEKLQRLVEMWLSRAAAASGQEVGTTPGPEVVPPPPPRISQAAFSTGSIGHPHACRAACKYFTKRGQCKDGSLCSFCHLCSWRRAGKAPRLSTPTPPGLLHP